MYGIVLLYVEVNFIERFWNQFYMIVFLWQAFPLPHNNDTKGNLLA